MKALVLCSLMFGALQAEADPRVVESTAKRPDIFSIPPILKHNSSRFGPKTLAMQFEFVAELLELYPGQDLYFLARDSEYLYDIARLLTAGTEMESKIHLLHVSTTLIDDPYFDSYLAQEKLTELVANQKPVVIVDTGLSGTIGRAIARALGAKTYMETAYGERIFEEENPYVKHHLMISSFGLGQEFKTIPFSRAALLQKGFSQWDFEDSVSDWVLFFYEKLPHFFSRPTRYQRKDGRIEPMGLLRNLQNKERRAAAYFRAHLRQVWENSEFRESIKRKQEYIRHIRQSILKNDFAAIKAVLRSSVQIAFSDPVGEQKTGSLAEFIIRDVLHLFNREQTPTEVTLENLRILSRSDIYYPPTIIRCDILF